MCTTKHTAIGQACYNISLQLHWDRDPRPAVYAKRTLSMQSAQAVDHVFAKLAREHVRPQACCVYLKTDASGHQSSCGY